MQAAEFGFSVAFGDVSFSVVGLFEGVIFPMYGMCDVETRAVLASAIALRCGW